MILRIYIALSLMIATVHLIFEINHRHGKHKADDTTDQIEYLISPNSLAPDNTGSWLCVPHTN